ncbi:DMT family transporter [Amaricoccus sp.]|uniref:DMT family transporter n=1 Tax=Amaricoccus sp. TaxID=1872485 RepID=UPI001B5D66B0|nr:DMT family transporter [Amaricoccus sp.]MBP7241751.1 DMT family transporter [Amaricoccus sp.]
MPRDDAAPAPPAGLATGLAAASPRPLRGVALLAASVLIFAAMDTTTKYLVGSYDPRLVVAVRYILHFLLMLAILGPIHRGGLVRTRRRGLVLARAACLVAASLLTGMALGRMPVAETTSIVFLSPAIVVVAAPWILGERFSAFNATAAAVGFAGVLLIARPGGALDPVAVLFVLGAAGFSSGYIMLSRLLAATETTIVLLFYTAMLGAVVCGLALPWSVGGPAPTPLQLGLFLATGLLAAIGHYFFTAAHRLAPASVLAPVNYLQILWAGVLGWLVFGHVPDGPSVAGMALVVLAGVAIALRSAGWPRSRPRG